MYKGIGASAGIGIGSVIVIKETPLEYTPHTVTDTDAELERFNKALYEFCSLTEKRAEKIASSAGEKEKEILEGHILMIKDPFMSEQIEALIRGGQCAEAALDTVCNTFIDMFSQTGDELTMQRATDIKDLRSRMMKILLDVEDIDLSLLPPNTVIVADDLTPSMTADIKKENIAAIVTQTGGKTSHSAIISRSMRIPAALSIPDVTEIFKDGDTVIVDGTEGVVILSPSQNEIETYNNKKEEYLKSLALLEKYKGKATQTADGIKLSIWCNIGTPDDADSVIENDGEGVGLFRTEFLFMERSSMPTEQEQFEAYKKAVVALSGRPLIIRTLDVGGDKDIPFMGLEKEENPFLGYRAVRLCLGRKEMYLTQIKALLRAGLHGDIRIMIPMVTCVEEILQVKELIKQASYELEQNGVEYNKNIPVGIMIETPAAAMVADILAKEVDFFSIGTNDLTQYIMAVDRGNSNVAHLYSTYNPAVLRAIKYIIKCGKEAGIEVGMCGEAAADALLTPVFISFGLEEYSVNPSSVLETRKNMSLWTKAEADAITEKVMSLKTEHEVKDVLTVAKK